MNFVVQTSQLRRHRLITRAQERALDEVYKVNPLLFDVVLKRCLRHPTSGKRFLDCVFQTLPDEL